VTHPHSAFQFLDPEPMIDGDLELVLVERAPAAESKWKAPHYVFHMVDRETGEKFGRISFRAGPPIGNLRFAGQVGYFVEEEHRGHRYAERSCRLLFPFIRRHGFQELWITCGPENIASRRILERLGAVLIDTVDVPPDYPMDEGAVRRKCIFRLDPEMSFVVI